MSTPIEERLRAHYAERTQREPLPGPDTEPSLDRLLARAERSELQVRPRSNVRRLPTRPLLLAAAVLVVCAVAGLVVARIEDPDKVSTTPDDDRDAPVTTVPRTTVPTTSSSVPTPDSSVPPVLPQASGKAIIVGEYGALGWWDGTRWVPVDYNQYVDGGVPLAGGEEYQIVRLDGSISTATGSFRNSCFNDDADVAREIDVGIGPNTGTSTAPIAVNGVANPLPRPVRALDASAGPYRAEATEVLAGLGITDAAPTISKVVAADLDGDGADEVIVAASRLSDPRSLIAEPGDYSVVFVRRGDGSGRAVAAQSIAQAVEDQTPYVALFDPAAVADLNGDGRMELVVEGDYYEGVSAGVHEYRADGTLPEVLGATCGA